MNNYQEMCNYISNTLFKDDVAVANRSMIIIMDLENHGFEELSDQMMDAWEDVHPETLEGTDVLRSILEQAAVETNRQWN